MYKTEGIVLRASPLSEADWILTLYTKRGKVRAVARGARHIRNRLMSCSQPFTLGRYRIQEGKNLATLLQGELIQGNQDLRENLEKTAACFYVVELVDLLTEEGEGQDEIFFLLEQTLELLKEYDSPLILRGFEFRMMKLLGYEPQLLGCFQCGTLPQGAFFFSCHGGVLCGGCRGKVRHSRPLQKATYELLKIICYWDYSKLVLLHPLQHTLGELELLTREYLERRLPREVKSREFLQTITNQGSCSYARRELDGVTKN